MQKNDSRINYWIRWKMSERRRRRKGRREKKESIGRTEICLYCRVLSFSPLYSSFQSCSSFTFFSFFFLLLFHNTHRIHLLFSLLIISPITIHFLSHLPSHASLLRPLLSSHSLLILSLVQWIQRYTSSHIHPPMMCWIQVLMRERERGRTYTESDTLRHSNNNNLLSLSIEYECYSSLLFLSTLNICFNTQNSSWIQCNLSTK